MDPALIGTAVVLVPLVLVIWLIARHQMRQYRGYLGDHVAQTRALAESQEATRMAVERQTAALERIAATLEKRG